MKKKVILIVLDGWGIAPDSAGNAITRASTTNFNRFWAAYPHTQLQASGEAVGLPKGEDGNSETGHLNLGAGQIVFQDLPRIDLSIADGNFFKKPAFLKACDHCKKNNSRLHLIGLIGSGGVHSSLEHLFALLQLAKQQQVNQLFLHLFTDGRDSPPTSATAYISQIDQTIKNFSLGKIASLCGRYFAMDRDLRWERTQKAYDLLTLGKGDSFPDAQSAIKASYQSGKTDEFIEPTIIDPDGVVKDKDAVIFFNFRIDRPRQLTKAFVLNDFENHQSKKPAFDPYAEKYGLKIYEKPAGSTSFKREKIIKDLCFVTMTEYEKNLPTEIAFGPQEVKMPLGRVIAENGLRQFHLAETEKERFVTYYFNGQRETPFPGEEWQEIPSPKVATYDLQPEMSAFQVKDAIIKKMKSDQYDFLLVNFANPDMVGHTGNLEAGIKAVETTDHCLAEIVKTATPLKMAVVITADHGNVEEMIDLNTGQIDTKHSTNPVPLIVIDEQFEASGRVLQSGILADIAPTILHLMGLSKPELMTGRSLL